MLLWETSDSEEPPVPVDGCCTAGGVDPLLIDHFFGWVHTAANLVPGTHSNLTLSFKDYYILLVIIIFLFLMLSSFFSSLPTFVFLLSIPAVETISLFIHYYPLLRGYDSLAGDANYRTEFLSDVTGSYCLLPAWGMCDSGRWWRDLRRFLLRHYPSHRGRGSVISI